MSIHNYLCVKQCSVYFIFFILTVYKATYYQYIVMCFLFMCSSHLYILLESYCSECYSPCFSLYNWPSSLLAQAETSRLLLANYLLNLTQWRRQRQGSGQLTKTLKCQIFLLLAAHHSLNTCPWQSFTVPVSYAWNTTFIDICIKYNFLSLLV